MITVGSKIKFIAKNGHPAEIVEAQRWLKPDIEYTVNYIHRQAQFVSFVFLDGIPGNGFLSTMFDPVEVTECLSH